jgi:tripeptide aminopeptidase
MIAYNTQPIPSLNTATLHELTEWTIEQAVAIQQIPAPTFEEQVRAEHIAMIFNTLGLAQVERDEFENVYGVLYGANPNLPSIMISAHSDTIFSRETKLDITRKHDVIYGAGLGDNSVGVAGMLALARFFQKHQVTPLCNVWFVSPSREEGLGDLGGMKHAFARLHHKIGSVINLEGLAFGFVYHAGIAVKRLSITAHTEGGHSWLHFGRPSATHAIVELGSRICNIHTPTFPRTTYNIGMIEGGQAINAIATSASLWLDLRSEKPAGVEQIESLVHAQVASLSTSEVRFEIEVVGDRPAGTLDPKHPLVQDALNILADLNVQASIESGSTDANIPLAHNCPAITIGITQGGNAHRLDEYIELSTIPQGLEQLIRLTLTTAKRHSDGIMG